MKLLSRAMWFNCFFIKFHISHIWESFFGKMFLDMHFRLLNNIKNNKFCNATHKSTPFILKRMNIIQRSFHRVSHRKSGFYLIFYYETAYIFLFDFFSCFLIKYISLNFFLSENIMLCRPHGYMIVSRLM